MFSNTEKYSLPNCFLDLTSKRRDGVTILLAVYCAIPGTIGKLKLFTGGIVNLVWYHSVPTHSARQGRTGFVQMTDIGNNKKHLGVGTLTGLFCGQNNEETYF